MDDAVIRKIQKLLARGSEAHNDNEHEREIAMRQAHALLAKHGLEMADVTDANVLRDHLGPLGRSFYNMKSRYVWERRVWASICHLNGCSAVHEPLSRTESRLAIMGRQSRLQAVASMALYVVHAIEREAAQRRLSLAGFGTGAAEGVSIQVTRILASMARGDLSGEQVSTGTALILVNQHKNALVEAEGVKTSFYPKLRTHYSHPSRNHNAIGQGREYGQRVALNTQVGGATAPRLK